MKATILRKKIQKTNLAIVFLQETKCSANQLQDIGKKIWKGSEGMGIDVRGQVGGLGILWDPSKVSMFGFNGNRRFISTYIGVIDFLVMGILTNVYGPHIPREKMSFIDSLRRIHEWTEGKHWILGGDFNLIISLEENKGGR